MKSKPFKTIAALLFSSLNLTSAPSATFAEDVCSMKDKVPDEVYEAAGCAGNSDDLPKVITAILYGIITAIGIVAVIYIIIGGINYMTSAGDAGKAEKAKKTIIYALIGIVVCIVAFTLVNFTIGLISPSTD